MATLKVGFDFCIGRRIGFFSFWNSKLFGALMDDFQEPRKDEKDVPYDAEVNSPVVISASVITDARIENLNQTVTISFKVTKLFNSVFSPALYQNNEKGIFEFVYKKFCMRFPVIY